VYRAASFRLIKVGGSHVKKISVFAPDCFANQAVPVFCSGKPADVEPRTNTDETGIANPRSGSLAVGLAAPGGGWNRVEAQLRIEHSP